MKKEVKEAKIANHLYDIICGLALPKNQLDSWAEMKRDFEKESKRKLRDFVKDKYVSVSKNKIQIGERNPLYITININKS